MQALTKAASIMGITMVGAMVASSVKVKLAWTITIGEASVVVLDILDSIIPGILSIVLVFGLMKLIKRIQTDHSGIWYPGNFNRFSILWNLLKRIWRPYNEQKNMEVRTDSDRKWICKRLYHHL